MSYRQWREENISELYPLVGTDALHLQRIARSLARLDEHSCNYGLSERQEKREERLEARATEIAKRHHLKVYRQGDPRGWPLYLYSTRALNKYRKRTKATYGIDACYSSVGVAVCPH